MAKAETGNLSKKSGYYDVLDASAYDVLAKAVTERMGAVLEEMHDGKLLKYDSEKELDKQLTNDAENDEYPSALLAAKKFEDVYGKLGEKISETDKTNEISENNKNKLPTVGAMTDYIDSVMPEGENRDATLLAMYNEILEPSPAEWFTVSGDTITGFDWYNEDFNNATALVFPYEINGVGIRHIAVAMQRDSAGNVWTNSNIKTVRFPNCVEDMQSYGDGGSKYPFGLTVPNMTSANIPTSCTNIGEHFFASCNLYEIITPVKPNWELTIGSSCFSATALDNIDTIIDGVGYIKEGTFSGCPVKNAILPESVNGISIDSFVTAERMNCLTVLNPNCELQFVAFYTSVPKVVKGYKGSTAEAFVAEVNGIINNGDLGEDFEPIRFVSLEGAEFAEIESEIGDIDAALDGIIAIQNNYIGGESA